MNSNDKISSNHALPIVLVSASDIENGHKLISELINSKISEDKEQRTEKIIWQMVNKYYRVNVEMYLMTDDATLPSTLAERIEAHIIYISDKEDDDETDSRAEERWSRAVAVGASLAEVRLLVTGGARAPPALLAWCRRRRYEPVPLRERAEDEDEDAPGREAYGAERARAALHAHTWRGLERVDRAPAEDALEDEDEAAVERADAFAEALGALGEAADAGGAALSREDRLQRAERLVAAFCRALGGDLPAL